MRRGSVKGVYSPGSNHPFYGWRRFCSSALISIIMRLGESRIQNNISTLAVNYAVCLLLSLVYSAGSGALATAVSDRMVIILGLISGFFYFGSFALYQYNIFRNGVLMTAAFMKLGVLVPVLLAVIAFGERDCAGERRLWQRCLESHDHCSEGSCASAALAVTCSGSNSVSGVQRRDDTACRNRGRCDFP